MDIISAIVLGLLFGSIPTAFLAVKKANGKDITKEGSGNVGTLNSHRVTGSYLVSAIVLLIDLIKGAIPILILQYFLNADFQVLVSSSIASVIGHCYSPWLKLKGGKGLVVAAGSTVIYAPAILIVWAIFWIVSFIFKRLVGYSNVVASFLTGALVIFNKDIMNSYSLVTAEDDLFYGLSVSFIMLIILSKHFKEIKRLINIK